MPDPVFADAAALFARKADLPLELTGRSAAITRVQELVRRAARVDGGALITGETGAAIDDVARELHLRSRVASGPFVAIECEAADATSVDRLLFGAGRHAEASDLEVVTRDSSVAAARGGTL